MKLCPTCGEHKLVDEFYRNRTKADGRAHQCKACDRARSGRYAESRRRARRRWVQENPEIEKERRRRRYEKHRVRLLEERRTKYRENPLAYIESRYGLTVQEFNHMVARQSGRCAVCGEASARLLVDHDHASGHVRGLLCKNCNFALGHLRDSAEIAERAAVYLRTHVHLFPLNERSA